MRGGRRRAPGRKGEIALAMESPGRAVTTRNTVNETKLTLEAAMVEAASPRKQASHSGDEAADERKRVDGTKLTLEAVVVEAASPRKRTSRSGDEAAEEESQRSELTGWRERQ